MTNKRDSPRLRFSKEELANPKLARKAEKAEQAAERYDHARKKLQTHRLKLTAQELGVEVQFVVIDWDNKIMELDSKNVDVLWNGMTLTDEVKNSMECTNPYFNNAQVVVTAGK